MFNKSLFAAFAAAATLGLAGLAKADTVTSISAAGTFSADNVQAATVHIQATDYEFTDPSFAPQVSGSVTIYGWSGNFGVNIGAPIASIYQDTVTIAGVSYPRAHLTTKRFFFYNLATLQKTLAIADVDVVKAGTRGMVCFSVTSVADGSTLAMSCDNSGNMVDLPLLSGSAAIRTR